MAIKVTEVMYQELVGHEYKTNQPFLESRLTPQFKRDIFQEPHIKKSLIGLVVPVHDGESVIADLDKTNPIGIAKVQKDLSLTIKFLDEKYSRIHKGLKSRNKFDIFINVGFYGQTNTTENPDGTQSRVFHLHYIKLAPNITIEVIPDHTLMDILTTAIDSNFPKGDCAERGKVLVLVAEAYAGISKELKGQYSKDKYMKAFLHRSGYVDVDPVPENA